MAILDNQAFSTAVHRAYEEMGIEQIREKFFTFSRFQGQDKLEGACISCAALLGAGVLKPVEAELSTADMHGDFYELSEKHFDMTEYDFERIVNMNDDMIPWQEILKELEEDGEN